MPTMRIATLNIWNRGGPWDQRLAAIRKTLRALDPDVIGLQEVIVAHEGDHLDQAKAIAEGFGYHVVFGASHGNGYAFGNAALSRWPITRSEVFALPSLDADERRSLLFAEIESPHGKLPFFVTHLSWKFHEGHIREAQAREVAERVRALSPTTGLPPVLVGDLNAEPDSDEVRFLKGLTSLGGQSVYFADAFGLVGKGRGITFSKSNPFAAPLREPERRIDYIMVRPDDRSRGEPLEARVCFDELVDGVYASDHFGVIATLSM